MSNGGELTLEVVEHALRGRAAAFRCVTRLEPAGGAGDKVFPPTYEGGKYATEERLIGGQRVPCVLLDSVQSQANRMELALFEATRRGQISLPLVQAIFDDPSLKKKLVVTSLEAPHRIADAIFRDCLLDGVMFRDSPEGQTLDSADVRNATGLFGLCPTALLFGLWDSTGPRGGLGAKFQRAIVSEVVGINAVPGVRTSSRIDPLQILLGAGTLYLRAGSDGRTPAPHWTLNEAMAVRDKKGAVVKLGKDGKPTEANHGNVTPTVAEGGFTIEYGLQTTVLSLVVLRRLRFPLNNHIASNSTVDCAAQVVLAALGIAAATLLREEGLDLRSRCLLTPVEPTRWELLDVPGEAPLRYSVNGDGALEIARSAIEKARKLGLPWRDKPIILKPTEELVQLVARSQELAAAAAEEG